MSENRRPAGRQRDVQGTAGGVHRSEEALHSGPVGNARQDEARVTGNTTPDRTNPQGRPRTPVGTAGGVQHGTQGGYRPASQQGSTRPAMGSTTSTRPTSSAGQSRPSSAYGSSNAQHSTQGDYRPAGQQGTSRPGAGNTSNSRPAASGGQSRPSSGYGSTNTQRSKGINPLVIIIALILLVGGGGGSFLFGGDSGDSGTYNQSAYVQTTASQITQATRTTQPATARPTATPRKTDPVVTATPKTAATVAGTTAGAETGLAVAARDRYTTLLGSGKDTVTIMVYMCGTDLESRSGMASSDLQEMAKARFGDNVRILVYTGGCKSWKISSISSSKNQIWRLADGKLQSLVSDDGNGAMTNPATLTRFIRYSAEQYPANRYELILWDHGGGSVSGYGYDEKYASSGSMSLAGIDTALKDAGIKFDFIGFDACLMATVETALMSSKYADYMIASEESEPGIGWYYTDWLTSLGSNTSLPTVELGKQICDDFVTACSRNARGQTTTLSVVDLAQLSAQVPQTLSDFARSISTMIEKKDYQTVSAARNGSREFARSSKIDQVDLVDLAQRMGNTEGKSLADTLKACVKYNRVSGITNANGLSIYFPYQKVSGVDKAVRTYQQIGMDDAYSDCIRAFASLEASGQIATGGTTNPWGSLSGQGYSYSSSSSMDLLSDLLGQFLGSGSQGQSTGNSLSTSGFGSLDFLFGRNLSDNEIASYIFENHLDGSLLNFTVMDGETKLSLPEDQWALVQGIDQNIFVDDGRGYIDLGLDDVYTYDSEGNLLPDLTGVWLSMDGQVVPYYHLDTMTGESNQEIRTGYIPALVNGIRKNLFLTWEDGTWEITGCQSDYVNDETDTEAKLENAPQAGDVLQFICDYYSYDGAYSDSYLFGDPVTVTSDTRVTDAYLPSGLNLQVTYRFTDLYNQKWWTNAIRVVTP